MGSDIGESGSEELELQMVINAMEKNKVGSVGIGCFCCFFIKCRWEGVTETTIFELKCKRMNCRKTRESAFWNLEMKRLFFLNFIRKAGWLD